MQLQTAKQRDKVAKIQSSYKSQLDTKKEYRKLLLRCIVAQGWKNKMWLEIVNNQILILMHQKAFRNIHLYEKWQYKQPSQPSVTKC